jgi:hypothetical protein
LRDVERVEVVRSLLRDRPHFHVGGTLIWNALQGSLQTIDSNVEPGMRTVETGCGASTVVFAARAARHTVISPDGREHQLVHEFCERMGIDDGSVDYVADSSDLVLPGRFADRSLDFAFIDGAHSFPYPVVDWHYISRALAVGGKVLVDDIPIPAVAPVFGFMRAEPNWTLDRIVDDRAALFTLSAEPPDENYNAQRFNDHPDYSFASLPTRLRIRGSDGLAQAKTRVGDRYPALRRAYKRLSDNEGDDT